MIGQHLNHNYAQTIDTETLVKRTFCFSRLISCFYFSYSVFFTHGTMYKRDVKLATIKIEVDKYSLCTCTCTCSCTYVV